MMHKDYTGRRPATRPSTPTALSSPRPHDCRSPQQPDPKTLYPGKGGFLVAELPYKGGDLSMVVIVPQDADGLPALEKKLTAPTSRAGSAGSRAGSSTSNCRSSSWKRNTR